MGRAVLHGVLALAAALLGAGAASGIALRPGDVVVANIADVFGGVSSLLRIDPATGNQSVISAGGRVVHPRAVAFEDDGSLVFADRFVPEHPAVIRVDPTTGDQTVVTAGNPGDGAYVGLDLDSAGRIWVLVLEPTGPAPGVAARVLRVDPATGQRIALWSSADFAVAPPCGLAIDANDDILIVGTDEITGLATVLRIDPVTGNAGAVTAGGHLQTTAMTPGCDVCGSPRGIAIDENGDILVSEQAPPGLVVRIDPATGDQTILTSGIAGPGGIAAQRTPDVFVTSVGEIVALDGESLLRVDPVTADRTTVSAGGAFQLPSGVAVVPGEVWATRAPVQVARQEVTVVELDGRIYVIGGFRGDISVSDEVEVYDPATDMWSFAAPYPTPVNHNPAAVVNGKIYAFGGWSDFFGTLLDDVYEYDPETDTWTAKAPMPAPRAEGVAVAIGGRIYVAGGRPDARENDFAVYDPATDTWTVLPDMPTGRDSFAAGAIAGKLYAAAGRTGRPVPVLLSALEVFDPATNLWSSLAPIPTARGGVAGAVVGRSLVVFGGEGNAADPSGVFEEVEAYDVLADTWTALTPMRTPRHGIGAAVLEGLVYVPTGAPVQGAGVTPVHEVYDPSFELDLDCKDAIDDDGDGAVDFPADPGCADAYDPGERASTLVCDDGKDNDGDLRVDFDPVTFAALAGGADPLPGSGDPGCVAPAWVTESPQCDDGRDNDGDELADDLDPHCATRADLIEACGLGAELVLALPALLWGRTRRRARR